MAFHSFEDKKWKLILLISAHQVYGISRVCSVFFLHIT